MISFILLFTRFSSSTPSRVHCTQSVTPSRANSSEQSWTNSSELLLFTSNLFDRRRIPNNNINRLKYKIKRMLFQCSISSFYKKFRSAHIQQLQQQQQSESILSTSYAVSVLGRIYNDDNILETQF